MGEKNERKLVGCGRVALQQRRTRSCEKSQFLSSALVYTKYFGPTPRAAALFPSRLGSPADIQEIPAGGKASVEPADGSNPRADCQRPAEERSRTRQISAAISNAHINTHTAQLLTVWAWRETRPPPPNTANPHQALCQIICRRQIEPLVWVSCYL